MSLLGPAEILQTSAAGGVVLDIITPLLLCVIWHYRLVGLYKKSSTVLMTVNVDLYSNFGVGLRHLCRTAYCIFFPI